MFKEKGKLYLVDQNDNSPWNFSSKPSFPPKYEYIEGFLEYLAGNYGIWLIEFGFNHGVLIRGKIDFKELIWDGKVKTYVQ